jgi:hypothetical protein
MSLRTVLISIIVAGALAALVLIDASLSSEQSESQQTTTTRALGVDPATITSISIESSPLGTHAARRDPDQPDTWVVELDNAQTSADPTRVRAALRAIASTRIEPSEDETPIDPGATLEIGSRDQSTIEIRFGTAQVGGRVRVSVTHRDESDIVTSRWFGTVETRVRDSLAREGFRPWRSADLFPIALARVDRATISTRSGSVTLARTPLGWTLTQPHRAPASRAKVESMLGVLLSIDAQSFLDDPRITDDLTGLGDPRARLSVRDSATGDEYTLGIGAPVDESAQRVYARLTRSGSPGVRVLVETKGIATITPAPLAYVHGSPLTLGSSLVRSITLANTDDEPVWSASRSIDTWNIGSLPASPDQRDAIDRLLHVLCEQESSSVIEHPTDTPIEGANSIGYVELRTSDDTPPTRVRVLVQSTDQGIRLLMRPVDPDGTPSPYTWIGASKEATAAAAWLSVIAKD